MALADLEALEKTEDERMKGLRKQLEEAEEKFSAVKKRRTQAKDAEDAKAAEVKKLREEAQRKADTAITESLAVEGGYGKAKGPKGAVASELYVKKEEVPNGPNPPERAGETASKDATGTSS